MSMNHDMMASSSMAMSGMSPTATGAMLMPSSTGSASGGMGGMSMGGSCKISVSLVRD
jgi:copper transporter 1